MNTNVSQKKSSGKASSRNTPKQVNSQTASYFNTLTEQPTCCLCRKNGIQKEPDYIFIAHPSGLTHIALEQANKYQYCSECIQKVVSNFNQAYPNIQHQIIPLHIEQDEIRIREQDIIDRIDYCMNQCMIGEGYEIKQHQNGFDIQTTGVIYSIQLKTLVNEFPNVFIHSTFRKTAIDVGNIGDN